MNSKENAKDKTDSPQDESSLDDESANESEEEEVNLEINKTTELQEKPTEHSKENILDSQIV